MNEAPDRFTPYQLIGMLSYATYANYVAWAEQKFKTRELDFCSRSGKLYFFRQPLELYLTELNRPDLITALRNLDHDPTLDASRNPPMVQSRSFRRPHKGIPTS